jgi:hypothetical protein
LHDLVAGDARLSQQLRGIPEVFRTQRQQQVLRRGVLVFDPQRFFFRRLQKLPRPSRKPNFNGALGPRLEVNVAVQIGHQAVGIEHSTLASGQLAEQRFGHAALLGQQRPQKVFRRQLRLPFFRGKLLSRLQGFAGLVRKLVNAHG